jgi:hypothetical protein
MNQDNNNIDKFFRSRLSEHEVPPPSGGFDAIAAQLEKEPEKQVAWWWSIAAACLLVLMALSFVFTERGTEVEIPLGSETPFVLPIEVVPIEDVEEERGFIQIPAEEENKNSNLAFDTPKKTEESISSRVNLEERMQADIDELVKLERVLALQQAKNSSLAVLDDYLAVVSEELSSQLELQSRIEDSFFERDYIVQQYQRNNRIPDVGRVFLWDNLRQIELSDIPIINRVFAKESNKEASEE